MADPIRPDQQLVYLGRFLAGLRQRAGALLSDELIDSYRRKPEGPHSDALNRVLFLFGALSRYALYSPIPLEEFVIVTLPTAPGQMPVRVDTRVFRDEATARFALFMLNVEDLKKDVS
jgi:branched-chain amino acid transport system permease protein